MRLSSSKVPFFVSLVLLICGCRAEEGPEESTSSGQSPVIGDWERGAQWRYLSEDGRYDLSVVIANEVFHAEKGTVFVVLVSSWDPADPNGRGWQCFTMTKAALAETLTERAGNYFGDVDRCLAEPWPQQWAADNVTIFEESVGAAMDFFSEVAERTQTGPRYRNSAP